jgi:hypothetical protein
MASSADIRDKLRQDREQDEQQLRRTLGLPTGRRSSDRLIRDQLRETKAELGRHQDIVARLRGLVDRWINAADEMAAQRDHLAREVLRLQHERTLVSEDLETARVNASRKSEQIVALRKCLGDLQLVAAPRELFWLAGPRARSSSSASSTSSSRRATRARASTRSCAPATTGCSARPDHDAA